MNTEDSLILAAILTAMEYCQNQKKKKQYKILLKVAYCIANLETEDLITL